MPIVTHGDCEITRSPYLNGCQIDGAGELLKWLYNKPSALPGTAQPTALKPFNQKPYRQSEVFDGLDSTGWVYVPQRCEQPGARCKLHVAFHGCEQGQNFPANGQAGAALYGTVFVEQAGYNRWADSMGVVVLYPQVLPSQDGNVSSPFRFNPKGCWDFWGYTRPLGDASLLSSRPPFARKDAPQMRAVKAMVDALLQKPASPQP
jgi:poly(3-hydroxybutyrate) depolymerase